MENTLKNSSQSDNTSLEKYSANNDFLSKVTCITKPDDNPSEGSSTSQSKGIQQRGQSSGGQGKMRIDPLQLLACLSVLLNRQGGIKSIEEVQRVAGLMGKYSKKLVSKCIYLNILQATDERLLEEFHKETGWDLVSSWLTEAVTSKNYPLAHQILNLLLVSPVTVERLKKNNIPKLVKTLSREGLYGESKAAAEKIVERWRTLVNNGSASATDSVTASSSVLPSLDDALAEHSIFYDSSGPPPLDTDDVDKDTTTTSSDNIVASESSHEQSEDALPSTSAAAAVTVPPDVVESIEVSDEEDESIDEDYHPGGVQRRRGISNSYKGRRKAPTRVCRKGVVSYADLLSEDERVPDGETASEAPLKLTIRSGHKILAEVKSQSSKHSRDQKRHRVSIDSTDSEDNKPLSLIKEECQLKSDDTSLETSLETGKNGETKFNSGRALDGAGLKEEKETDSQVGKNKKATEAKVNERKTKRQESEESIKSESVKYKSNGGKSEESKRDKGDMKLSKEKDKKRDKLGEEDKRKKDHGGKGRDSQRREQNYKSRRMEDCDEKKEKKEQVEKDRATLDRIKPLSSEGLAKIPRKPIPIPIPSPASVSFLEALGKADAESKKPAIKAKSRGFRDTGLLDDPIKPPGIASKRSVDAGSTPPGSRRRPTAAPTEQPTAKKNKSSSPLDVADRPGGSKLISPRKPSLADDGGFMAALTAAGESRKKVVRKRRSSESDPKIESPTSKVTKIEKGESKRQKKADEITPEVSRENSQEEASDADDIVTVSPTNIKPPLNFYQETMKEEDMKTSAGNEEEEDEEKEGNEEEEDDDLEKEEAVEKTENDWLGDEGNGLGSAEEVDTENDRGATPQEEYDKIKIEVTFSEPKVQLKSAILYQRPPPTNPRKVVTWKPEETLTETFLFPMDETERVNVNTVKFNEMMQREKANEKELMLGKHKNQFASKLLQDTYGLDYRPNNCVDYMPYKLYPIHLPNLSKIVSGSKSVQKLIQAQREHATMAAFFRPDMLPDSPSEPDPELVIREEPKIIPKEDVSGAGAVCDHRPLPWPDPLFEPPPENFPFFGVGGPPNTNCGGHWVQGSQILPRFDSGPMFGASSGPPPPQMRPPNINQVGFPPSNFPPEMSRGGGGWVAAPDFGGPPMMMPNNPNMMGQGPIMQPNLIPTQNMGPPGMGMGMNMIGPPLSMRGKSGQRFRRGGGDRGGSWRGSQGRRQVCRHFRNGNCRRGSDCKYLHSYPD